MQRPHPLQRAEGERPPGAGGGQLEHRLAHRLRPVGRGGLADRAEHHRRVGRGVPGHRVHHDGELGAVELDRHVQPGGGELAQQGDGGGVVDAGDDPPGVQGPEVHRVAVALHQLADAVRHGPLDGVARAHPVGDRGDQPATRRRGARDRSGVRGDELGRDQHLLTGRPARGGQPAQRPVRVDVGAGRQHQGAGVGHPVGTALGDQLPVARRPGRHTEQGLVQQHLLGQLAPGAGRRRVLGRPVADAVPRAGAVGRPPHGRGHRDAGPVVGAQVELGRAPRGEGGSVGGSRVAHAPTVPRAQPPRSCSKIRLVLVAATIGWVEIRSVTKSRRWAVSRARTWTTKSSAPAR